MESINETNSYVTKLITFNLMKTGNPIFDAFLTTAILGLFSWVINWIYNNEIDKKIYNSSFDDFKSFFYKKNTMIIEGKKCSVTSSFTHNLNISSAYSNRFKAIWDYIIMNIENNKTIYKIKENHSNHQSSSTNYDSKKKKSRYIYGMSKRTFFTR